METRKDGEGGERKKETGVGARARMLSRVTAFHPALSEEDVGVLMALGGSSNMEVHHRVASSLTDDASNSPYVAAA